MAVLLTAVLFIFSVIFSKYLDGIEGPKASEKVTNIHKFKRKPVLKSSIQSFFN